MNKKNKIPFFILAILIGVLMFIYAGIDDSPGGAIDRCAINYYWHCGFDNDHKKNSSIKIKTDFLQNLFLTAPDS